MRQYIALIHKEPGSDYGVSFPDFPGCVTAGADLDAARGMAEEALAFHVEGMAEEGEPLPEPSTLEGRMRRTATGWRSWFRWRTGRSRPCGHPAGRRPERDRRLCGGAGVHTVGVPAEGGEKGVGGGVRL